MTLGRGERADGCLAKEVRDQKTTFSRAGWSSRIKMSRESKSIGKLVCHSVLSKQRNFTESLDRQGETQLPHPPMSVAAHSSWKQPLCIFHSPSALLLYSWDGSYFQFNERGEHTALHWTQMGPQRVPNQFLLDKGKNKSRDVYGSDEM